MLYRFVLSLPLFLHAGVALALSDLPIDKEVRSFIESTSQLEVETSVETLVSKILELNRKGWADADVFRGLFIKTQEALSHAPSADLLRTKLTALQTQLQTEIASENRKRLTARVVGILASAYVGFVVGGLTMPLGLVGGPLVAYWAYTLGAPHFIREDIDPDLALFFIEDLKNAIPRMR